MSTDTPFAAKIAALAPTDDVAVAYDQCHLALYASLIEAEDAGQGWRDTVRQIMHLDPKQDGVEACWRSHLDRAYWIISDGLASAVEKFGTRPRH